MKQTPGWANRATPQLLCSRKKKRLQKKIISERILLLMIERRSPRMRLLCRTYLLWGAHGNIFKKFRQPMILA